MKLRLTAVLVAIGALTIARTSGLPPCERVDNSSLPPPEELVCGAMCIDTEFPFCYCEVPEFGVVDGLCSNHPPHVRCTRRTPKIPTPHQITVSETSVPCYHTYQCLAEDKTRNCSDEKPCAWRSTGSGGGTGVIYRNVYGVLCEPPE